VSRRIPAPQEDERAVRDDHASVDGLAGPAAVAGGEHRSRGSCDEAARDRQQDHRVEVVVGHEERQRDRD
jgi:hypothetical protein